MSGWHSGKAALTSSKRVLSWLILVAVNNFQNSKFASEWKPSCNGVANATTHKVTDIFQTSNQMLKAWQQDNDVHLVQIGAHVGFEQNDPIAKVIMMCLHEELKGNAATIPSPETGCAPHRSCCCFEANKRATRGTTSGTIRPQY